MPDAHLWEIKTRSKKTGRNFLMLAPET